MEENHDSIKEAQTNWHDLAYTLFFQTCFRIERTLRGFKLDTMVLYQVWGPNSRDKQTEGQDEQARAAEFSQDEGEQHGLVCSETREALHVLLL